MVKRRRGSVTKLEGELVFLAFRRARRGEPEFHGFDVLPELGEISGRPEPYARSSVYRALERLEEMGLLSSRWEDAEEARTLRRPRRRLYRVTEFGANAAFAAIRGRRVFGRQWPRLALGSAMLGTAESAARWAQLEKTAGYRTVRSRPRPGDSSTR